MHPEPGGQRLWVQITPPGAGGVRDHASALHAAWRSAGLRCEQLALDQQTARHHPLQRQLQELAGPLPVSVLLHFSGYGYAARGLCAWLAQEVAQARLALGARLRVVGLFHELFASGPPWRSSFWLQPWQQQAARALLQHCDAVVTNTEHHGRWLHRAAGRMKSVHAWPVFSNVGEPAAPSRPSERAAQLVLFGSAGTRARAARQLQRTEAMLRALGITGVTEIGPGPSTLPRGGSLGGVHLGPLPPDELSTQLLGHRFALIDYPVRYLGKSGVFAAYAAHGCVVLNTAPADEAADGLEPGVHEHHLTRPLTHLRDLALQDRSGLALHRWYLPHALDWQAAYMGELLGAG